jgi:molybdopterin converting factor small subunit
MSKVTIEVVAWVTRFVGGTGSQRRLFSEALDADPTVRGVLRAFGRRFPELADALWDRQSGDLAEHIEVLVNDRVLGIQHTLDSALADGDRVTLVGAYMGGVTQ